MVENIKVNKLPSKTWYWLGVNDSSLAWDKENTVNLNEEKRAFTDILTEIALKIKQGEMIDLHYLKSKYEFVDDSILELVSAHNDSLVGGKVSASDSEYSYKDLITKYEDTKKELVRLNGLIEKTDEQTKKLVEENNNLKQENEKLNEEREQIKNILVRK